MKLNIEKPNIETSEGMSETLFSIGDHGIIFDILRSKMYSNPILSICREITCNARDTQRVMGKQDIPIEITLPNTLEPFFKVKDFGEGMSPERIENVFVKYACSTKRNDNIQTGGWGLGAKTPWSLVDSFTIETVYDGVKYNYACVIDETKVGKLVRLFSEPTDAPNGTEFIVPVKAQDFKAFRVGTEFTTRHWEVKPILKGDKFEYPVFNFTLTGDGWAIDKNNGSDYYKRDLKLIIDGIEYPVDLNQLRGYANTKVLDSVYGVIYLYFGVGELSLSASREAVHLDQATQDKISNKLASLTQDLKNNVLNKLDASNNLWEATIFYHNQIAKTFADTSFLGNLQWKGYNISKYNYIYMDNNVYEFRKGVHSRRYGSNPDKISRSASRNLRIIEKTAIYLNDLGIKDPTTKQILPAFTANSSLESIQVICLPDNMTWDDLNKKYNLDQMPTKKLSEIAKAPRPHKNKGARLLIFKFDSGSMTFKQSSYDSMEEDKKNKILCKLQRDTWNGNRTAILDNDSLLDNKTLISLLEINNNTSIYGIDTSVSKEKIDDNFEEFTKIEDFIEKQVLDNKSIDYMELKYLYQQRYTINKVFNSKLRQEYTKLISNQNSLYIKNIELLENSKNIWSKYSGLLHIYENLKGIIPDQDIKKWLSKNKDKDIKIMEDKIKNTYPLINHVDPYNHEKLIEPIAHYINLVDKENN